MEYWEEGQDFYSLASGTAPATRPFVLKDPKAAKVFLLVVVLFFALKI